VNNKERARERLLRHVRVSIGSAVVLGLLDARLDVSPTTVYLMTYKRGRCTANCAFCPQARGSRSRSGMLSRISWPIYQSQIVIESIEKAFLEGKAKRVCVQALNYSSVFDDLSALVNSIHKRSRIPISVSCQPLREKNISSLFSAGAERLGIPLDAATEEIFAKIKGASVGGPYDWKRQFRLLKRAVEIFGKGRVSTHLIVGLGETDQEMVKTVQKCVDSAVLPGLFAFTPIPGTRLARKLQPQVEKYRRIQLARHLILNGITRYEEMEFDEIENLLSYGIDDQTLLQTVENGQPFLTSGCPHCNRPYYNEKPSGPIFNYPRRLAKNEIFEIKKQFNLV
jgi:biotin synthase-related radical SAM superfamily protein